MMLTSMKIALIAIALYAAYTYRLYAIEIYGLVIHEFDPWFNFRATKYLAENGWTKFFTWFDYKVWYPLGMQTLSPLWKSNNRSKMLHLLH